ncbi:DUF2520 domain-containing protein [Variovorax humicola]|uniref:DUF2520 domain-containing protein n=1 Tax=Variovorax humicola TaxID=1769758 RepID=A0ABU8VUT0_9BURK
MHGILDPRIGFIGAGRLGKALAWSLAGAGLRVTAAASNQHDRAAELAARIDGCEATTAQAVVDGCDLVFVTTPDAAIARAVAALRWRTGVAVVHCSGVTEVDALAAARDQGASIGGFHPMQTFGDPEAAVASLPGSTITIEAESETLNAALVMLAQRLGCRVNRLPPGMRGRYHAAAGFTSQFINALFAEAARVWESWGATEADALQAMMPMAKGTLASIESAGIARGMPGPVSRGDVSSVEKHVAALGGLGSHTLDFYRVLCGSTVKLALEGGAIDASTARQLEAVLQAALQVQSLDRAADESTSASAPQAVDPHVTSTRDASAS